MGAVCREIENIGRFFDNAPRPSYFKFNQSEGNVAIHRQIIQISLQTKIQ